MNNNYVEVLISGKNVNNYIKWLVANRINVIKMKVVKHNELDIIVDYRDYEKLSKYSKTYKVKIVKRIGKLRLIQTLKNNLIVLISMAIAVFFLYMLSNIIFSVDIVYNDKEIVNLVSRELKKYGIKKFRKKKNYIYLDKIKSDILQNNRDVLEWIEIEEMGTKYIVRLVERKRDIKNNDYIYQSIVAKRDAVITSIKALTGEKVKNVNQYVRRGDVVISGMLTKPDGTNLYTKATGRVYGDVWYKIQIEYPLYYQEERITGKSKDVISFGFLSNKIYLFPYQKYKQFRINTKILLKNNFIPFEILKEKVYEVIIKENIYTQEEAIDKAIELSKQKMMNKSSNIIKINDVQIINKQNLNSKIRLDLFVSVSEDISEIVEIKDLQE